MNTEDVIISCKPLQVKEVDDGYHITLTTQTLPKSIAGKAIIATKARLKLTLPVFETKKLLSQPRKSAS